MGQKLRPPTNQTEWFHLNRIDGLAESAAIKSWLGRLHRFITEHRVRHVTTASMRMTLEQDLVRNLIIHDGLVCHWLDCLLEVEDNFDSPKHCWDTMS